MPRQYYIKNLQQTVVVKDAPFASGGEGALFEILQPTNLQNCVAKIFHKNKRDPQKESKIDYLITHPPIFKGNPQEDPIVWVKYALHSANGEFMGFIMPKATGEKLEVLTAPKLPKRLGNEWNRFRFGNDDAMRYRLLVCYNIASALRTIHETGKYVLVDLKPDNILIKSNGVVSIVDTDSIEVIENGQTLFPATVATPEYTPAEYYKGIKPGKVTIDASWDCFSLAVIYYRLLFGVHPYAATSKAPYDNINALGDKIKHGLFVHDPNRLKDFVVVPPPHRKFASVDRTLRKLFLKTFVDGANQPELRPSAEDWGQALRNTPLLLTNRSLPSKSLKLNQLNEQDWYWMALQQALKDHNLLLPDDGTVGTDTAFDNNAVLSEAIGYYKQAGKVLGAVGRYVLMVIVVVLVLFTATTMLSGDSIIDVGFAIGEIIGALLFIPKLILEIGGIGFAFFILLLPFLLASFRQFTGMAKNSTQEVRKSLIGSFSFTDAQKKRSLEELQYTLFNQRTKVKQRLRELKNELVVLTKIKSTKEKKFFNQNNRQIIASNHQIVEELRTQKNALSQEDERARVLMVEEAKQIKAVRLELQEQLTDNPTYANLPGKTIQHKIALLQQNTQQLNASLDAMNDGHELIVELQQLEQSYEAKLTAVKTEFDTKHDALLESANDHKIRIDDLINGSVDTMRKQTKMDANLMDDSFKRLLRSMKNLQIEVRDKERELTGLTEDIKELKDELKNL